MNEIVLFCWIGYFTVIGIILTIGIFAWATFINMVNDVIIQTFEACEKLELSLIAYSYLKNGEIKDYKDGDWRITDYKDDEWKIEVIDENTIIVKLVEE
jgi:hypothetical protein